MPPHLCCRSILVIALIFVAGTTSALAQQSVATDLETSPEGLWREGASAELVADVAPGSPDSGPSYLLPYDGDLHFFASILSRLYRYDAATDVVTEASTVSFGNFDSPVVYDNAMYFSADGNDGAGEELWKYDAATATASRVADIYPGISGSDPRALAVFGTSLFFSADGNDGAGREMWRYDASTNTASRVVDLWAGAIDGGFFDPVVLGGRLYFSASNGGVNGSEVWEYDGANVTLAAEIRPGAGSSSPNDLTIFRSKLHFTAFDGTDQQIWSYDPAIDVATKVTTESWTGSPRELFVSGTELFFIAAAGGSGEELWGFDGISTFQATTFTPSSPGISDPTAYDGAVYFRADGGDGSGFELWRFDGTTTLVDDIRPGSGGSNPQGFAVYSERLYFSAIGSLDQGNELWRYPSAPTGPTPIFVDHDAMGVNDGTSWANAYTDLQSALAVATGTDEIWVAAGTYKPTAGADRAASFTITGAHDGLKLYGGFAGTETTLAERDLAAGNTTVLSGDIGTPTDDSDNSYHVVYVNGRTTGTGGSEPPSGPVTASTLIDGTVVTMGNADASGSVESLYGGGLYCDGKFLGGDCSITLSNVTFIDNLAQAGGALFNDGRSGGVSSPTLTDVVFADNSANTGGAVYSFADNGTSNPSFTNVLVAGNTALGAGGVINDAANGTCSPTFTNVTFANNSGGNGSAIRNTAASGGVGNPVLTNVIVWGNSGGPSIYNLATTPTFSYSLIEGGIAGISENGGSSTTDGGNNLNADPLFVDANDSAGPDGRYASADDGLRIAVGSPAVDAGDNAALPAGITTDIVGAERIQGGTVDMGPYEGGVVLPITATSSTARGWRMLSVPVPATVADLTPINLVGGVQSDPLCDSAAEGEPITLFTGYNGGQTASDPGFTSPANYSDALEPGDGFFWYFFSSPDQQGQTCGSTEGGTFSAVQNLPVTLSLAGTGATTDRTVTIDNRVAGDDEFYLGGNAFAEDVDLGESALTFVAATDAKGSPVPLQNQVQVYDPSAGGYVLLLPAADGGSGTTSDDLAVWQGAWLERTNAASPNYPLTLTYAASARTGTRDTSIFIGRTTASGHGGEVRRVRFALTGAVGPNESAVFDGAAAVVFAEGAGTAWDAFDGSKLGALEAPFALLAPVGENRTGATTEKAAESLALDAPAGGSIEVPLAFYTTTAGAFELSWPELVGFPDTWTLAIHDTATGQSTDLRAMDSYAFGAEASEDWIHRFSLRIAAPVVPNEEQAPTAFALGAVHPNPSTGAASLLLTLAETTIVRAEVFDVLGRRVALVRDGEATGSRTHRLTLPDLIPGSYFVRVTAGESVALRRFTVIR